ncbi:MAG TPA: NADH-quinone oxidoreductase subunit NuoF [Oscillospiraceae bacterium]|nr:NADH-quinone oxidoreductase subunit NuoF [Oscillospiraceae bacterium]
MEAQSYRVRVGLATCGIAAGASKTYDKLVSLLAEHDIVPERTGCIGMCFSEPLVEVTTPAGETYLYGDATADKVAAIVEQHIVGGKPVEEMLVLSSAAATDNDHFMAKQHRVLLGHVGVIDPESIDSYLAIDGYIALTKVINEMTQEEVIKEVQKSGLRGRGGAGFPTGMKWNFTYQAKGNKKYVVCNADEGDPGAFMDRSVLEGDPHALIEGMTIAAFAIGADEGYIYVRAEYPLAIKRLQIAIKEAKAHGYLGNKILGTDFCFDLKIKEGAGAFVCGEETALLASIEGLRGIPRPRPPFPANSGLWGKPTLLNNVETYANVPVIFRLGADEYGKVGAERSKGTKVFALTGKIKKTGLAEVPMGITMREIIYDVGGGIQDDRAFKAVQIGGPSGGCLPEEQLDLSVDYDSLTAAGAMMGSGGLVVMDETTCMVDLAKFFLTFTQSESCGKCTPCREGTKRMLEILERITAGQGKPGDIETLEEMGAAIRDSALCGLGQTAPNPVLSTLRYFRHEYEEHINEGKCRAGVCSNLISYNIIEDKCVGCTVCAKNCPVNAISGERKQPHEIDQSVCIKCGVCMEKCKFDAIILK